MTGLGGLAEIIAKIVFYELPYHATNRRKE
jgi:hypothetical protein